MWPFSDKKNCSPAIPAEVLERLDRLEHQIQLLKVEWSEVYDKIAHQFDRERKRRGKALMEAEPADGNSAPSINWNDPVVIASEARKRGL